MTLHPEFIRLVKREAAWPMVLLVLVLGVLGFAGYKQSLSILDDPTHQTYVVLEKSADGYTTKTVLTTLADMKQCANAVEKEAQLQHQESLEHCKKTRRIEEFKTVTLILYNFTLVLFIYSASRSLSSFSRDIQLGTWDYQRLATSSPLGLILAKVFGATSLVFFAFILNSCIVFAVLPHPLDATNLVLCGFLTLVLAAIIPTLLYVFQVSEGRTPSLLLIWIISFIIATLIITNSYSFNFALAPEISTLETPLKTKDLYLLCFGILAFIGAARLLYTYQVRMRWPWFALSCASVVGLCSFSAWDETLSMISGLQEDKDAVAASIYVFLAAVFAGFTYVTAILSNRSVERYRRITRLWQQNGAFPFKELPLWVYFFAVTFIVLLSRLLIKGLDENVEFRVMLLSSITLFMLRDLALLHIASLRFPDWRGDLIGLAALGILYIFMPILAGAAGFNPFMKDPAELILILPQTLLALFVVVRLLRPRLPAPLKGNL
ncbi:MAG: hypothetical protein ACK5XX_06360 [Holosporales bacterium]